jgi:hypothetical protein
VVHHTDVGEASDKELVRRYPQRVFVTVLVGLSLALISAFFFYCFWRTTYGLPPNPIGSYKASTRMFMATPKEFQIAFWLLMSTLVLGLGILSIWKMFRNPSVLVISSSGIEYRGQLARAKFVSWNDLRYVTFTRGIASLWGRSASVSFPLFLHGLRRKGLLCEIGRYRPDLAEKLH